jgi:hypothetical protein
MKLGMLIEGNIPTAFGICFYIEGFQTHFQNLSVATHLLGNKILQDLSTFIAILSPCHILVLIGA